MEPEKELEILEYIYRTKEGVRQRDLAEIAGVSLGMINVILKRLVVRGWIKVKKINNRNIHYIVSPAGMDAISHRSYSFFKRTVKNLVYYKDILERLILEIKHRGYTEVVLVGRSEVDFLVEHFCLKYGVGYIHKNRDVICEIQGISETDTSTTKQNEIAAVETENGSGSERHSGLSEEESSYLVYSEEINRNQHNDEYMKKKGSFLRDLLIG